MWRWGLIGPGAIAVGFAQAMGVADEGTGGSLDAVCSRSRERANDFADRFGIARRYDNIEALAADEGIDVVYIATPQHRHADDTIAMLNAGKHVLCEKPFALNAAQTQTMIDAARANNRFLMEALWSRFLPAYRILRDLLDDGHIGEVLYAEADFGFRLGPDPNHRLMRPELGGGALLDLGIYPVHLCSFVLGHPERVTADARLGATGVDEWVAAVLHHRRGALGQAKAAISLPLASTARIGGTAGVIELPAFMHCPGHLTVSTNGTTETIDAMFPGNGLHFEIEEVHRCLSAGAVESTVMSLADSLGMMRTLDSIRQQIGLRFPGE